MRDTSHDVDDPDASMTDPSWHKTFIYANSFATTGRTHSIVIKDGGLVFTQGNFASSALRMLVKPTMKGFWVPVNVLHGATLRLGGNGELNELIGLQNCAQLIGGKIELRTKKMRSFELVPISYIYELDIRNCEQLLDLERMPDICATLWINYQQLKQNLKHIFYACRSTCTVKLPSDSDKTLENVINQGLKRKAGQMTDKQALLRLQTDLIDHDFDEYSDI